MNEIGALSGRRSYSIRRAGYTRPGRRHNLGDHNLGYLVTVARATSRIKRGPPNDCIEGRPEARWGILVADIATWMPHLRWTTPSPQR
jgi:hypothetical protein